MIVLLRITEVSSIIPHYIISLYNNILFIQTHTHTHCKYRAVEAYQSQASWCTRCDESSSHFLPACREKQTSHFESEVNVQGL